MIKIRSNSITAKLIQKKKQAENPKAANTKKKQGGNNTKKSIASKPRKGKKGYADMMDQFEEDVAVEVDLSKQKEIANKKATRMEEGEEALAEKKKNNQKQKRTVQRK